MADVLLEKQGHTGIITLNRPDTLNALCAEFISSINNVLDDVEKDREIYTLVITGTGRAFIAGADIAEMCPQDSGSIMEWSRLGSDLNLRLESMECPVIAAINGYALGGGLELALACDIRIASEKAKLGLPETSLGVICGAGGTQRLPLVVGEGIAKEMLFTAKTITADEALNIGLVNHVTTAEALMDETLAMCRAIEKNGQLAVRAAKKAVNFSGHSDIESGCLFERMTFSALFDTEDQKIGMNGFLKKEKNIKFKNNI